MFILAEIESAIIFVYVLLAGGGDILVFGPDLMNGYSFVGEGVTSKLWASTHAYQRTE